MAGTVALRVIGLSESYFTDDGPPPVLWMLLGLLAFRDALPLPAYTNRVRDRRSRRAWATNVEMALDTLDPGSQDLLKLRQWSPGPGAQNGRAGIRRGRAGGW